MEKQNVMNGLAERLLDKLKVDGPEFEEIYLADGDLTAIKARDLEMEAKYAAEAKAAEEEKAAEETKKAESNPVADTNSTADDELTGKPL